MQQGGVGGQPRLDLGAAVVFEKPGMQADQVVEHGPTDIGHAALADPRHQVEAAEGTHRQGHHQQQEQADGLVELMCGAGHEALVHQQADALAHGQGDGGGDYQGQQGQQHLATVRTDKLPTQAQGAALTRGNRFGHDADHIGGETAAYHSSTPVEPLQGCYSLSV
ncbi:hypothetical protein D3C72_879630 [compost metagenome]